MSAADSRTPRLTGAAKSLRERLVELLSSWRAPSDPLLALAIDEEIENHIMERAERLMEEGLNERQARREAERRFGDVRRVRRSLHGINDAGGGPGGREFFRSVLRDLALGWRSVLHAPGFALAVVVTIGLGVGANAAVFSVTDAVLLRPLPYQDPDELVAVETYIPESDRTLDRIETDRAARWQDLVGDFGRPILYGRRDAVRTDVDDPYSIAVFAVSPTWTAVLGVNPRLGRGFTAEEASPGAPAIIILGHSLWRDRFGADPRVIGSSVELDHRQYTVVGVMPYGFKFPVTGPAQAWVPLLSDGTHDGVRRMPFLSLAMRPDFGLDLAAVQQRLDALASGLQASEPSTGGWSVRARVFDNFRANSDVERALWVLTGAVGVMLLIAVVNATNLLLVRAGARRAEIALRLALGASRGRVIRQQLTENFVLVAGGGLLAILTARGILWAIVDLLPSEVTFFLTSSRDITVDGRVLGFALIVTAAAGLLGCVLPAVRASSERGTIAAARFSGTRSAVLLRNALVVTEIAMTVALLIGAGLLINSFLRLTSVDPGYNPDGLVQLSLGLPETEYPNSVDQWTFFGELRREIAGIPGVEIVTVADGIPPGGSISFGITPQAEGMDPQQIPELYIAGARVDPAFFATLQTPIVAGRNFTATDTDAGGNVIIDRSMARFLWGGENPVGRRFRLDSTGEGYMGRWLTVVGMVDDVKLQGQDDRRGRMEVFRPMDAERARSFMSVMARVSVPPGTVLPLVRDAVRRQDPDLPVYRLTTGAASLAAENDKPRFFLLLMSIFAAVALSLAIIGTYGMLSFAVRQRHRELGVRIALGANNAAVRSMVLRQGIGIAALGVAIGAGAALAFGGVTRTLLFEVEPTDPATFALVAIVMLGCAAAASWIPARRATHVDPVDVLRAD